MDLTKKASATMLLAIAGALSACGGGGNSSAPVTGGSSGGSSGSSSGGSFGGSFGVTANVTPEVEWIVASSPTEVVTATGSLQGSLPESTYADAEALSAFTALNAMRSGAGAGLVAQSVALDTAATAHARYLTTNSEFTHSEDPAKPEFYGVWPSDRLAQAGFSAGYSTEVIAAGPSATGAGCVAELLNSVYHAVALLSQATHVGFGFGLDGSGVPLCVVDLATDSLDGHGQVAPSDAFVAYPYVGQRGVIETFYVAYESPRPSAVLFPNLTAGTPVVVNVRNADFLNFEAAGTLLPTVTQFVLTDANGNIVPSAILANPALVAAAGVTLHADANLPAGSVVLVPLASLSKGVAYSVTFAATLTTGGRALANNWTFTTNRD